jgi:hypothetical protein
MAAPKIRGRFIDWQAPSIDALFPGMLGWVNRQKIDLARLGVFEVSRRGNWAAWQIDPAYCGEPFNPEGDWPKDPDLAGFLLALPSAVVAAVEAMPPEDRAPERVGSAALAALPRPGQPQQTLQAEGLALAGDRVSEGGSGPAPLRESERLLLHVFLTNRNRPLGAAALEMAAGNGWPAACKRLGFKVRAALYQSQLRRLANTLHKQGLITREGERGGWYCTDAQARAGWEALGILPT